MAVIIPSAGYRSREGLMALLGRGGQLTLVRLGWKGRRCLLRLSGVDVCLAPDELRRLGEMCIEHSKREVPDDEINLD